MHFYTFRIGLSKLYNVFKGDTGQFLHYDTFLSLNIYFIITKGVDPDEMTFCGSRGMCKLYTFFKFFDISKYFGCLSNR